MFDGLNERSRRKRETLSEKKKETTESVVTEDVTDDQFVDPDNDIKLPRVCVIFE